MMRVNGEGALGVWHDIATAQQYEGEEWYNREHHAERVAIAGFLRARRYVNLGAGRRYFSRYDTDDVRVLASERYRNALNSPTPWSQRIFPHYQNTVRGAFQVVARNAVGEGGFVTTLRFGGEGVPTDAALAALTTPLVASFGVVGVEVWRADAAVTGPRTREIELRAGQDRFPDAVLLVEATAAVAAAEALRSVAPDIETLAETDVYQLVFQKTAKG